jgi:hypothetical protein
MAGKKYSSYHGHAGQRRGAEPSDGLFGWTVFIFLLFGVVFLCWMGPEKVANYRILQRLHKLEAPQRFEITAAPRGEFLKPEELLERFGPMTEGEIRRSNETLLRSFIRNYRQNRDLVPYAVGNYKILGAIPLSDQTFCSSGYVALLQAVDQPEILLEQLFTANEENLPALKRALRSGQQIKLEKPLDLSAIIFIERLPDNRLKLTTMPLLYGTYGSGSGPASFSLTPPSALNLTAGLPVLTPALVEQLSNGSPVPGHGGKNSENLVRLPVELASPTPSSSIPRAFPVDSGATAGQASGEPQAVRALPVGSPVVVPAIPVGTPIPIARPTAASETPAATPVIPEATPAPAVAVTTPAPAPTPRESPAPESPVRIAATSSPTLPPTSTTTNPPAIFATNAATATLSAPGGHWPVYAPGRMPRGELLDPSDTHELAAHGIGNGHHYLRGRFVVTAAANGKAVLRPEGEIAGVPIGPSSKIRVIVEFPAGAPPPPKGNTISRGALRPFLITSVKKGDDGEINVYAREVTKGE